ncbi:hypothetical protein ACIOEZ_17210 [Streptomyces sp. NPDC087866]|uniref:hypothetical protein n=1 Tax=unclassified Streptomyces TaxID=2593676 RepID=UPI00365F8614
MHPIEFEADEAEGVHVFRYLPRDNVAVSRHWPGLVQSWPEEETPFTEWAVNNNNMEEVAVYVGLVWRLTAGLARYAIPAYYRDDAERVLGRAPVLVDWEYEVDAEQLTGALRDKGFVPGRSAITIRPKPTAWQVENTDRAGVFPLVTPRDLVAALHAVIFDASSEITVFAVAPGPERFDRLVAALRGPKRPTLAEVLGDDGVFVDLTIGSDLDNYDSVIVASPADMQPRVADLTADYARRIEAYEQRLHELRDVPDFLRAMRKLVGVDLDAV